MLWDRLAAAHAVRDRMTGGRRNPCSRPVFGSGTLRIAATAGSSCALTTPPPPRCFLEVLILRDFKSFAPELVILKGLKRRFAEVLILEGLRGENGEV